MNTTTITRVERMPRSRRRLLVAVALAGFPAAVAVLAGLKHTGLNRWLILAAFTLVLLPTVATLLVGYRYARGRIDGRARLDERDRALRQQAYALSHRVLAAILLAVTASTEIYLTSGGNTLRFDANTFWPVTTWVIVYLPALPSLMLAWIETDQPADA
ncbi:MAG TPA: hypothetical protein VLM11_07455 [Streptosporangiaceae bacterium]|nr:hypothetical protein [Streptosporangiaceae bacterium]